MAMVKKCDICGNLMDGCEINELKTFINYKCKSQHDGEYMDRIKKTFDLCDECAKEIVRKIPGQNPDAVIVY